MASVEYQRAMDVSQTRVCEFQPPIGARIQQKQDIVDDLYHGKCRLLVIYGEIFAGKAYFAKQVVDSIRLKVHTYRGGPLNNILVRCLGVTSWDDFLSSLALALGANTSYFGATEFDVKLRIRELTNDSPDVNLIIVFTNFEDILSQDMILRRLVLFIQDVLDSARGVSVLVTSRVNALFSHRHDAKAYKLEPLGEPECLNLLVPITRYCKSLEPIYNIVRRCCYRPALILRICQILQIHRTVLTPEEVAHTLRTPEGVLEVFSRYPTPEGSLTLAIRSQLDHLPSPLESDAKRLCYLNGTFGVKEATKKLRKYSPAECKLTTLVPLHEHAILKIDSERQLVQIDPFIRAFLLEHRNGIRHNDPYKKMIVGFLGEVLRLLRVDVSVKTKGRALGIAQDNFRSLEMTLTQAVNTFGEESYKVYLQVVELEEGSMSAICPEKAVSFYKGMAEASTKYGSAREQALLQGIFAVSLIEQKGDQLSSAVEMVTDSLEKLTSADNYHRVVLMRRLGWMHIRLGNNNKAKRVLTQALDLTRRVPRAREAMVEPHNIQILSHLAIVNSFLGNFPEADKLLRSTIPRAKRIMPHHPTLAVLLQTMGLNMERQGYDDQALTYYQVSGNERQKLETTLPSYLVTNLNNRASRYVWRGDFEKAFPLLEKALNLRRKLGWWDYNTGLTLWYRANAYLFRSQADESVRSCEQAKEVFVRCTPRHNSNVDVRLTLAHAYMVLGCREKAEAALQETLHYATEFQENMNEMGYLTSLEHLILMRELESDVGEIHQRLIQEAVRLSDVFRKTDNSKYFLLQRKLSSWREYFGQVLCRDRGAGHAVNGFGEEGQGSGTGREGHSEDNQVEGTENCLHREADQQEGVGNDRGHRECGAGKGTRTKERHMWEDIRFTCRHCAMLGLKYRLWRQTQKNPAVMRGENENTELVNLNHAF